MDLGLLVVLIILGNVILSTRKKKRNPQDGNPNEDNTNVENRTDYDWSNPGEQNRPGPRSQQPTNPMPPSEGQRNRTTGGMGPALGGCKIIDHIIPAFKPPGGRR